MTSALSLRRLARPTFATALTVVVAIGCEALPTEVGPELGVDPVPTPEVVRGLYVNAQVAGSGAQLAALLDLADGSALNTFVIDVKERGEVSYASSVPLVSEVGAARSYIPDVTALLATLRDHGVYPIARIVAFRDPVLAEARPDLAIRTTEGGVWLDPDNDRPWVDPYHPTVWAYNIELAREALSAGFAEIQWDYVRFPDVSDSVRATMVYPAQEGRTRVQAITDFIAASRAGLADFDSPVTADVFGRVIVKEDGSGIGQDWDELVHVADVLLPMVYPALWWPGNFGIPDPNAEPYGTVRAAMDSAVARLATTPGARAEIRPWLQAFTEGGTVYGAAEIQAQIQAVEDAGLGEWLFWNPESVYPVGAF